MNRSMQLIVLGTFWCFIHGAYCIPFNNEISAISVVGSYPGSNSFVINSTTVYIVSYSTYASIYPTRLTSITTGARMAFPIRVVVRQQKGVSSWQLPLRVNSKLGPLSFYTTSRTLCHTHMDIIANLNRSSIDFLSQLNHTRLLQEFSISVSTSSLRPLDIEIATQEAKDFYIKENQEYTVVTSPSEPIYYYYKFFERNSDNYRDTVVLEVNSEDQTCFYVSIQEPNCPIYDLESEIHNGKFYQTVNTRGGLTVGNFEFPNGFFVVFVAKGDNYDCSIENSLTKERGRLKTFNQTSKVNFKVRPSISIEDYIKAALIILGAILIFYIVLVAILCTFYQINKINRKSSLSPDVATVYLENFQSPMMRSLEIVSKGLTKGSFKPQRVRERERMQRGIILKIVQLN
ncbi:SID1 transmembrane family member 1-like isoform X2 [Agrilus planipennis]|uniref:SID1 transmembrane family member 1-like isoform X2 n=1 Tax=Agrilus planipennis TaxID=224129 RepID=A0A7F5RJW7_AGRPL|nr:SID1 transmembrane family member 1-like isoform X2 [Agrilus planipennis]